MAVAEETLDRLAHIPNLTLHPDVLLSSYTRFGIGGPAAMLVETSDEAGFIDALRLARQSGSPYVVIGGGTNLVVADRGFAGIVLRFTASEIRNHGVCVYADAGVVLQTLVDFTTARGLQGLETMTGIPGSLGAAIYGNAGAYGHSLMERVDTVRFFDGEQVRSFGNEACGFHYRDSVFKRRKDWVIFSTTLRTDPGAAEELKHTAGEILKIRNEKYPPTMKCAGSIFKNVIVSELPEALREQLPAKVVRDGKAPSAWFLEQVGAKGLRRGDIRVATYHANLIYNVGNGTAADLTAVIGDLKDRVRQKYGFDLEEEVQYVGF